VRAIHRWNTSIVFAIALTSCNNDPSRAGWVRLAVTLEDVRIERVPYETLFSRPRSFGSSADYEAIVVRFSSSTDLHDYFREADKAIQVRCWVDGSSAGDNFDGFGFGPFEHGIDISRLRRRNADDAALAPRSDGRHEYTTYVFVNLTADSREYKNGSPAMRLDLRTDTWSRIGCHVIGVDMVPLPFPRTNDLVISNERFHKLLETMSSM